MNDRRVIAVDPTYRIRDNQFWYADSYLAPLVRNRAQITIFIEGLGERTLTHAAAGRDGRPTKSFTLPDPSDRQWWKLHRGHQVRVELLTLEKKEELQPLSLSDKIPETRMVESPTVSPPRPALGMAQSTLCIGLDIAWFGGSSKNPDSQYDCLAAVSLRPTATHTVIPACGFSRIRLLERDCDAAQLLAAINDLLKVYVHCDRVVFALDAPLQASGREHLPPRQPLSAAGTIERRACENHFSLQRQLLDGLAGGSDGWHPNIQPGAPLAPRVASLMRGLYSLGFKPWTPQDACADRLVIECFPAEAIWAAKRLGHYSKTITAAEVKAYKDQNKRQLSPEAVRYLFHRALDAFAVPSGDPGAWMDILSVGLSWLLADNDWKDRRSGLYRGGKLLDDVVDSMICLATSVSYVHGESHVWLDPDRTDDGHIIGPGRLDHLVPAK